MINYTSYTAITLNNQANIGQIIVAALRSMGMGTVHASASPEEVLKRIKHSSTDLLIIDHKMGATDGADFVRQVRTDKKVRNRLMPIIMLTTEAKRSILIRAIKAGVDEVILVPVSPTLLAKRVEAAFQNPRDYIHAPSGYVGPDRRRSGGDSYFGDNQRKQDLAKFLDRDPINRKTAV